MNLISAMGALATGCFIVKSYSSRNPSLSFS
jgi:hypothetical protein